MFKYWVTQIEPGCSAQEIEDRINRRAKEGWKVVSSSVYGGCLTIIFEKPGY